ncbi:aldehyde dehydrogenase family protein [Oricola nitratireducens]|uniref:aldehyde dehydrogenase family protein n=1 Tax=Oricola nitratireducens TaxID=2775868 RepID=UPI001865C328
MVLNFPASGRWISGSGQVLKTVNPATGDINAEIGTPSPEEIADACIFAHQSAASDSWRKLKPHERATYLYRISAAITEDAEDLAQAQMLENGKALKECRQQAASAAATFRYYAAACETLESIVPPNRGNYLTVTTYEPYGVVAAITPWNSPLTMEAQKVAPALAAGNAVVLKPSEVTTLPSLTLARICEKAGLPAGLLTVLPGYGRDIGPTLLARPEIRMVSFTGGTETGRAIAGVAAKRLIPAALELGGKSPHIILDDADIPAACDGVIDGIFEGMGQSCVAGSRLFVPRAKHDQIVAILVEKAEAIRLGQPTGPDTDIGPLSSHHHRDKVEEYVEAARKEGGIVATGGSRPVGAQFDSGAFYRPTIITGLTNSARVCQEEIFGPVLCVLPFDDEDDLVATANDTAFGLACGIWTSDYRRAWRIARSIDAGTVWINTYKQLSIAAPFGGFKESGIGREKGLQGMRLYQQAKSIYFATA